MSTHGLEHERDHPVVDAEGNPVVDSDPTLLPRDPDGTEADASAEAEYRAGMGAHALGSEPPATTVAEPIVLPAGPDSGPDVPAHRSDAPLDGGYDVPGDVPGDVPRDEPLEVPTGRPDIAGDSTGQVGPPPVTDDVSPATTATTSTPGQAPDGVWLELQGQFVDDPQAAVRGAADLLERAIADIRRELESSESTEDLRTAFRRYRDLYRSLR